MKRNNINELFLYLIVGVIATLTEWIVFFLLDKTGLHYAPATVTAYIISTFANWAAGRLIVFRKSSKPFIREITEIYAVSIIGLLMNLVIMWLSVDILSLNEMLSKIAATAIVFLYNFLMRKLIIYRK